MTDVQRAGVWPRIPEPAPTPPRGIHTFVWYAWPWVNWLLPVFFCFRGLLSNGGWESLALMMFSPIIIPVFGLLGSLPRFILRKRGHTTAPGPIVWLLFLYGWSWFVAPMTIPGTTDSSPLPSLLHSFVGQPLSDKYQGVIFVGSLVVGTLAWLAVLILSALLDPQPQSGAHRWTTVSWIAALVVPVLFVVATMVGVQVTAVSPDSDFETNAAATERPLKEQGALMLERYERVQESVSEVRAQMADDDWTMTGGPSGLSSDCRSLYMECYFFDVDFMHPTAGAGVDRRELVAQVEELGWFENEQGLLIDEDGTELSLTVYDDGRLLLRVESGWWWGSSFTLQEELSGGVERYDPDAEPETFTDDEWPSL